MNVNVPLVVTGDPVTVKMDGAERATLVTEPPPPVLVIVTVPVLPLTLMPLPAVIAVTPLLDNVSVPPNDTGLPLTLIPVPPVTVMLEFNRLPLGMPVGRSATVNALNVGTAAPPDEGPL